MKLGWKKPLEQGDWPLPTWDDAKEISVGFADTWEARGSSPSESGGPLCPEPCNRSQDSDPRPGNWFRSSLLGYALDEQLRGGRGTDAVCLAVLAVPLHTLLPFCRAPASRAVLGARPSLRGTAVPGLPGRLTAGAIWQVVVGAPAAHAPHLLCKQRPPLLSFFSKHWASIF